MKRAKSENDDVEKQKERQPYLSGAYIRSFVKQISSSSSSTTSSSSSSSSSSRNCSSMGERAAIVTVAEGNPQKKQVRRRLQTRKPYQEKLLNMAEARREIVTALKLHRAAMKQHQHHHHHHHQEQIMEPAPDFQKSRRNPRIYAAVDNHIAHLSSLPPPLPPPPLFMETLDFALPSQALGLNLNLHDFVTVPSSSIYSSSSPSTSSSSPPPPPPHATAAMVGGGDGERFEFLEVGGGEEEREEEVVRSPFDEVMEFPPWLNANESCLQHVDSPDFFHASVLPCMEIEEIEGMDGDWLA